MVNAKEELDRIVAQDDAKSLGAKIATGAVWVTTVIASIVGGFLGGRGYEKHKQKKKRLTLENGGGY
jgi:hypothetical protein